MAKRFSEMELQTWQQLVVAQDLLWGPVALGWRHSLCRCCSFCFRFWCSCWLWQAIPNAQLCRCSAWANSRLATTSSGVFHHSLFQSMPIQFSHTYIASMLLFSFSHVRCVVPHCLIASNAIFQSVSWLLGVHREPTHRLYRDLTRSRSIPEPCVAVSDHIPYTCFGRSVIANQTVMAL